ncbi:MAG: outer membrane protein assembly factor BamE [Alphaproteobacteria bacterium]|nr:outer membrane protein assembly factor BamE [Alphaproteobacteria bacterium]
MKLPTAAESLASPQRRPGRPLLIVAFCAGLAWLPGCAADVTVRGNAVDKDNLAQLQNGVHDRGKVRELLGSPTNVATFSNETWYYVSQKEQTVAFSKAKALSRQVIAISFNGSGQVAEIKTYTLADGREIDPVDRKTPTPGREFSIIEQLIGNLGRFEGAGAEDSGL